MSTWTSGELDRIGGRYPATYVEAMVDPKARATTLRLVPRG